LPARSNDVGHHGIQSRSGSAGDQHMEAFGRKPLAELRAKPLVRPDADDNYRSHRSLLHPQDPPTDLYDDRHLLNRAEVRGDPAVNQTSVR
jgi:hypothetical protein